MPSTLIGQVRRATTPDTKTTAAWGDPPIVLRCGVPRPAALTPTAELYAVDGVEWFPEQLTAGTLFTTYGRAANVEVTIPETYAPSDVLPGLSQTITAHDPTTG